MRVKIKTLAGWVVRTELVWVSLVLLALATFFLSQPLLNFSHTYFSPVDILQSFPTFLVNARPVQPHNYVISDDILTYLPWHEFAANSLRQGRLPLWNPYNAGGRPLLANMQGSFFNPLTWPGFIFGQHIGLLVRAYLYLYLAGLLSFLYFKSLRLWSGAALTGAVAFMFSGMTVIWLHTELGATFILLPLLLLVVERRLSGRLGSRQFVVWLGLAITWQVFAGHPETVFLNSLTVTFYLLFRLATVRGMRLISRLRIIGLFGLAGLTGIALSAVQLFPFIEYMLNSASLSDRSGFRGAQIPVKFALSLALPNPFGNPTFGRDLDFIRPAFNYSEISGGYVGLSVLFLALFSLWLARRRPLTWFWLGMSLVALAVVYNFWPFYQLVNALSPFAINYGRLVGYAGFFLIAMMAQGLDEFYRRLAERGRPIPAAQPSRWRLSPGRQLVLAGTLMVALTLGLFWWFSQSRLVPFQRAQVAGFEIRQFGVVLVGLLLTILSLLAAWRWPQRVKIALGVVVVCLVGQLGWFGREYRAGVASGYFYPKNTALHKMTGAGGRLALAGPAYLMPPEVNMRFGIDQVNGYDSLEVRWYERLRQAAQAASPNWDSQPVLNLFNIKQVLTPANQPGFSGKLADHNPQLTRAHKLPYLNLYRNNQHQPRYRLIYQATAQDENTAVQSLVSGQVNVLDTLVFIQGQAPANLPPASTDLPLAPPVKVLDRDPNHARLHLTNPRPGYLYIDQTYFPGWQARINGQEVPLYRANVAFTALPVPSGDLTIELEYNPLSFRLGLWLSLSTLTAWLILANWGWLNRLLRRPHAKIPRAEPLAA